MLDDKGLLSQPFLGTDIEYRALAAFYRRLLVDEILPWWSRHALDHEHGGICSCIRDDGTIISYDKYVWTAKTIK